MAEGRVRRQWRHAGKSADGLTLGVGEGEKFAGAAQFKIGVERLARGGSVFSRGEDDEKPSGGKRGGGKRPLGGPGRIVAQMPAVQIDGRIRRVM